MEHANLWGDELIDTDLRGACLSRVAFTDDVDLQTVTWDSSPSGRSTSSHKRTARDRR
jgi:hypothetical protein